jgi:hypothetical protein
MKRFNHIPTAVKIIQTYFEGETLDWLANQVISLMKTEPNSGLLVLKFMVDCQHKAAKSTSYVVIARKIKSISVEASRLLSQTIRNWASINMDDSLESISFAITDIYNGLGIAHLRPDYAK